LFVTAKNLELTLTAPPAPTDAASIGPPFADPSFPAVLLVTPAVHDLPWVGEALDDERFSTPCLVEAVASSTAALGQLHVQPFHALVVRHTPPAADALDLLDALYLSGIDQPVIVLVDDPSPELLHRCYELGADAVLLADGLTQESLGRVVHRAVERFELRRDRERLAGQERRRLVKDHHEAEQLLEQQRLLIRELETAAARSSELLAETAAGDRIDTETGPGGGLLVESAGAQEAPWQRELPEELGAHYRELLRTYIIMGSGSLSGEIAQLSKLLVSSGTSPQSVMRLHLESVEHLVRGLGNRSSRHVMSRAHLLALEVMVHLANGYQQAWSQAAGLHQSSHEAT
jgi:DNA-binding NarL/FixJ family response regulator